ncbi:MAG: translation initiation factor IF-2 [Victivallaceae bacterium]|nr:translation initiation factor IF-2 [Victivallaceae bacterium]
MKKLKIKDLAKQYGAAVPMIADELAKQGIECTSGVVPEDMNELVIDYFDSLFKRGKSGRKGAVRKGGAASGTISVKLPIVVKNLAEALGKRPNEVISTIMKHGELAAINQTISEATARKVCKDYGVELVLETNQQENKPRQGSIHFEDEPDNPEDLSERPPVVTFLGHVDHGKTSLQDAVRHTHVVEGEAGRITQHIGASTVVYKNRKITFIDTPGHEAFTSMRARGANATDIAILVVSATEGFKPQTVEALNHALAAKVPVIVAMNKMDLPDADPDKVLLNMSQNGLASEDWGGNVGTVRVSAKTGKGLTDLLDRILLESEMLELKANFKKKASGIVLEAQIEPGLGATAHVLVKNGTLRVGDPFVVGEAYGKVKMLISDHGEKLQEAPPSTPVKLVGLSAVPEAGDKLYVRETEKAARQESEEKVADRRAGTSSVSAIASVDDLFNKLNHSSQLALNLLIKSDVRGSGEAIAQSLAKLPSEKVKADVIANSVGSITENDVMLAAASNAIIVGFHVRVNPGVNDLAKKNNVEIRLYSIIYELLEEITDALAGKLAPEKHENSLGKAKILQIFELSKGPKICGCKVLSGIIKVSGKARVFRGTELIYNGEIASLHRFQDDVKEVKAGFECGIRLDNFADFLEGDEIECFDIELKKASL